ncbi:MAG: VOC family protein [Alphaproteobacteria bacterium]
MPSIDTLKKQAKQYLRWHKDGYYPVAATIRSLLPKYKDLTDRQILTAAFKLADAQELVARRHGFESWQALKEGLVSMANTTTLVASKPTLMNAMPQIPTTNLDVTRAFYTEKLGFKVAILYGEPAFYMHLERDGARLIFKHTDEPPHDPSKRNDDTLLGAEIVVDDVKALFKEFQSSGVPFYQALRKEPWGSKTFIVDDPDGNLILFAGTGD